MEVDAVIEEISALAGKKELMQMYNMATEQPYSFLFINFYDKGY